MMKERMLGRMEVVEHHALRTVEGHLRPESLAQPDLSHSHSEERHHRRPLGWSLQEDGRAF